MSLLVSMFLGVAFGIGLFVAWLGVTGRGIGPRTPMTRVRRRGADDLPLRVALGIAAAAGAGALTRWPVAAPLVGLAAAAAPTLFGARSRREHAVARTEAVAAWAEMLRDTMAAAAGLEEAIMSTAAVAPVPIRDEIRALARRLERQTLEASLTAFADEMDDAVADMVVASILLTSRRQARRVGELLGAVAGSARATAAMRRRVEASRARTYTSMRLVVMITISFTFGLVILSRDYLAPFDDAVGQGVLLLIGSVFGVAYWAMVKLAEVEAPERLLARVQELT